MCVTLEPEKRRSALAFLKKRYATCGACGCEEEVTIYMKVEYEYQFRARPDQETDMYYCGCQDMDWYDGIGLPPW